MANNFSTIIKSLFLLAFLTIFICFESNSQLNYKTNQDGTDFWYENILNFQNSDNLNLKNKTVSFLKKNGLPINFEDENSIQTTIRFKTRYRGFLLFLYNNTDFSCVFDVKIEFKDNKLKYFASDFVLAYLTESYATLNWNDRITAKTLPTLVKTKSVLEHFIAGKTEPKHLLFQNIDQYMVKFEKDLEEFCKGINTRDPW
jgi:hypothetical protein